MFGESRAAVFSCLVLGLAPLALPQQEPRNEKALQAIDLQGRLKDARIAEGPDGLTVTVDADDGRLQLSPQEYVRAVYDAQLEQRSHGALYVLFNITKPWGFLWVAIGFLGQALFTLRMVLQWLASEKHKRSIVPLGFWWGSLFGGMLLLVYFIWRKDIVGIIGQSTGVFIYVRNLALIYRTRRAAADARELGTATLGKPT